MVISPQAHPAERRRAAAAGPETDPEPTSKAPDAVSLLHRTGVLRWCVIIFLYVLAETALISFVNLYLFKYRAAPERVAIQAIAWFWAIMLVGRLLCSILPSTLANRKLIAGAML